jgi:ABC-type transport system involved in multi-copper enzyme maturation permease subunit
MSFLPIVHRELRAAARRKSTFRIRTWTAVIGTAATAGGFVIMSNVRGAGGSGQTLFSIITGYAFLLSTLAGIFLTADSLSAEKREGTLGLLFLTDLKGYDVVLGKLAAMSLNAFYALLALLPAAALPFLVGGLTGGEFWRTALALLNALFFSLAVGVCISALSRDSGRALGATFAALTLATALPLVLPLLVSTASLPGPCVWLGWPSPLFAFLQASEARYVAVPRHFWGGLLASFLSGGLLIGLASLLLPRLWQEKTLVSAWALRQNGAPNRLRRTTRRGGWPERLVEKYPVLRMIDAAPLVRTMTWSLVGFFAVGVFGVLTFFPAAGMSLPYAGNACAFLLKMLIAVQVCRFFAEARQTGSLELLLCTPLRNEDIIEAQWVALKEMFLWPLVALIVFSLAPGIYQFVSWLMGLTDPETFPQPFGLGTNVALVTWHLVVMGADIMAIVWGGMWLALSMRKPALAGGWTILLVLVIPSFFCGLGIFADLFFFLWGYTKLRPDFRWTLTRQYELPAGDARR